MDRRIDIHTHILPGVDDGSKTIEESIRLIKHLKKIGITDIVLTSHYIMNSKYQFNSLVRNNILNNLKEALIKENIKINLYLGNEVYLSKEVISLLRKKEICTLNNSKYMLVELPLSNYLSDASQILCELSDCGVVPIIAHPERYRFIQEDKNRINELLEFDALLQINVDSLVGKYGKSAKKIAKWLLKKDLVHFVGSDIHHIDDSKKLKKAYKKLRKIVGKEKYYKLTVLNPQSVIKDEELKGNVDYLRRERSW